MRFNQSLNIQINNFFLYSVQQCTEKIKCTGSENRVNTLWSFNYPILAERSTNFYSTRNCILLPCTFYALLYMHFLILIVSLLNKYCTNFPFYNNNAHLHTLVKFHRSNQPEKGYRFCIFLYTSQWQMRSKLVDASVITNQ